MEAVRTLSPPVLEAGPLTVQPEEGLALAGGRPLNLSVHELALLAALVRRPDRVLSRDDLYRAAWGSDLRAGDRSVDVYVRRLRVKLARALPEWSFIHTHVGFGYRLTAERSHLFHNPATQA